VVLPEVQDMKPDNEHDHVYIYLLLLVVLLGSAFVLAWVLA
jgi:hypothetical protein